MRRTRAAADAAEPPLSEASSGPRRNDDWRGRLYPLGEPRRRWLCLYAERFETVEVNTTFYRLPKRDSVAAWVKDTPSSFVFAVKASRY